VLDSAVEATQQKPTTLPDWHDDDGDEYDEEDDVVFGEENASNTKSGTQGSNASASKTTQNSSSGKDSSTPGTGPTPAHGDRDTGNF